MRAKASLLLLVTGVAEVIVGIGLLLTPGIVLVVLLGIEQAPTETLFVGRITGTAILGIGLVSWLMRNDAS
jgi:hypothetical protein